MHLICKQIKDNYWELFEKDVLCARVMLKNDKFYSFTQNCYVATSDSFEDAIESLKDYKLYHIEEDKYTYL